MKSCAVAVAGVVLAGVIPALFMLAAPTHSFAQSYPDRPVHLIIPYGPGGIVDFAGRTLAQKVGVALHQTIVPDNRPGAGGIVGVDYVSRAEPNGYDIAIMDPAIVINSTLQKSLPYDLFKNLTTVSTVSSSPEVLVVAPQLGIKSYAELVAYGKANPGKLNYASAGIGTTPHLGAEMWKAGTGIDAIHVPYKGIGASFIDMMDNKVQMAFSSIAGALPFTSDSRVIPLATTGKTRSPVYPNLPTVAEAGLPGYEVDLWLALYAASGTPPDVVETLNKAVAAALQDEELKQSFAKFGLTPHGMNVADSNAFTKSQYLKWKKVIEDGHISAE
ncbi:MAG TPA: tripartite tricarboxylate transporter substrate binding protein [Xanthobacteraceae bacterium]|jgi:tripartite-type tricarboxylate transporter receptor subunit TctC|nr:tripartite tricarboxylate transporter substrate binding protein [Xanthobacteraceae bacterium]